MTIWVTFLVKGATRCQEQFTTAHFFWQLSSPLNVLRSNLSLKVKRSVIVWAGGGARKNVLQYNLNYMGIKPKGPLGIPPRILFPQPVGTIFRFRPTPTNLNTLRLLYFFVFWEDSPHATVSTDCSARPLALRSNPMPVGAVLSLCGRNSFPGYGRRARGLTLQGSRFFSYDGSSYMSVGVMTQFSLNWTSTPVSAMSALKNAYPRRTIISSREVLACVMWETDYEILSRLHKSR